MKTQLILRLYDALINGEKVGRLEFCKLHSITERTFYRYIKEINMFFIHHKRNVILDVIEPNGEYFVKHIDED